jgi:coproporphyrinogen III oxidase-like Fe-S oxidoreductase
LKGSFVFRLLYVDVPDPVTSIVPYCVFNSCNHDSAPLMTYMEALEGGVACRPENACADADVVTF